MLKALLVGLLEPTAQLRQLEAERDFTSRLAVQEEVKSLPFGSVWDYYCQANDVPVGPAWLAAVKRYERDVQSRRG